MAKDLDIFIAQAQSLKREALLTEKVYLKKLLELLNLGFINCCPQLFEANYTSWNALISPTWEDEQDAKLVWGKSKEEKKQYFEKCQRIAQPLITQPPAPKSLWQKIVDFISPNRVLADKHVADKAKDFGFLRFFTTQLGSASCHQIQARGDRLWQDVHLLFDMMTKIDEQIEFYQKQIKLYRWSPFGALAWKKYTRQKHECDALKKKMKANIKAYIIQLKSAILDSASLPHTNKEQLHGYISDLEKKCCSWGVQEEFSFLKKHLMKLYLKDLFEPPSRSMDDNRIFPSHLMDLAKSLGKEKAMTTIKCAWELNAAQMPSVAEIRQAISALFDLKECSFSNEESSPWGMIFFHISQKINCENHACYEWLKENQKDSKPFKTAWNQIQTDRITLSQEIHEIITREDKPDPGMAPVLQAEEKSLKEDLFKFLKIETIKNVVNEKVNQDYHGHSESAWIFLKSIDDKTPRNAEEKVEEESGFLYVYAKKRCLHLLQQRNFIDALSSQPMKYFPDLIAQDNDVQKKLQSLFENMPDHVPELLKFYQVVMEYGSSATKQIFYDKLSSNHAYATCANHFLSQDGQIDIPDVFLRDQAFQNALRAFIVHKPLLIKNIEMLMRLRNKPAITDAIDEALNLLFDNSLKDFVHPNKNPGLSRQLDNIATAYQQLDTPAHAHRALCWYCLQGVRLSENETKDDLQEQLNSLLRLLPSEPKAHALKYFLVLCQLKLVSLTVQKNNTLKKDFNNFLLSNATNFDSCSETYVEFRNNCNQRTVDFTLIKTAQCLPPHARPYTPPPSPNKRSEGETFGSESGLSIPSSFSDSSGQSDVSEAMEGFSEGSSDESDFSLDIPIPWITVSNNSAPTCYVEDETKEKKTEQLAKRVVLSFETGERNNIRDQIQKQLNHYRSSNDWVWREKFFWNCIAGHLVGMIRSQEYGYKKKNNQGSSRFMGYFSTKKSEEKVEPKTFEEWRGKIYAIILGVSLDNPLDNPGKEKPIIDKDHFLYRIIKHYDGSPAILETLSNKVVDAKNNPESTLPITIVEGIEYLRCLLVAGLAVNNAFFKELLFNLSQLNDTISNMDQNSLDMEDWLELQKKIAPVLTMVPESIKRAYQIC